MLKDIIEISPGFQSAVNIEYDFNDEGKISGFIPTSSALDIIDSIITNTETDHLERAKILTGAYGRGKSHTVLVALSILYNKDYSMFRPFLERVKNVNKDIRKRIKNYIKSSSRLLPVIINGNSGNLTQSFLGALQQALKLYDLEDIMPETHFVAALNTINRWESQYPDTYSRFSELIGSNPEHFKKALAANDLKSYRRFYDLYPELTAGSEFNPFIGFSVVDVYDKVNVALKAKGYSGMYVVYDEFGKYLESNISTATDSETKMLQDFAEKCNRESSQQLHLLLICHKDISNYIDANLPQEKVNGWRGISGRFEHLSISNHFHQMYEIIAYSIKKKESEWTDFVNAHEDTFSELLQFAQSANFLSGKDELVVRGCYPLHPVTAFILPRLSERIAQNERTLFTFLSSNQKHTLREFIKKNKDDFPIVTPDYLYDYFEQELRKELGSSEIHKTYQIAQRILYKVERGSLAEKIIKTIAVIYFIEQFDRIAPTMDTICAVFNLNYTTEEIKNTVDSLIHQTYIVYIKNTNHYLCLKESSGIDIHAAISNQVEKIKASLTLEQVLDSCTRSSYFYPVRHNEEKCLTRYFDFKFISYQNWINQRYDKQLKNGESGHIYALFFETEAEFSNWEKENTQGERYEVLIVPEQFSTPNDAPYRYLAALELRKQCSAEDTVLQGEYDMVIDDLEAVVEHSIALYTHPELQKALYYHNGKKETIYRRSHLTELLSKICDDVYIHTPVINNESINKDQLPTVAINSRAKLIKAILESETIDENLGLVGSGQDVSFLRSTLIKTGILCERDGIYGLYSDLAEESIRYVLQTIRAFFAGTAEEGEKSFAELYERLTDHQHGIGMKKGAIPVYLAVVLHDLQKYLIFKSNGIEIKISADALASINLKPEAYSVVLENWNPEKAAYIQAMAEIFSNECRETDRQYNSFTYIVKAMERWYLSLPRCSKLMKKHYQTGKAIEQNQIKFMESLNQHISNPHEYLMKQLPTIFSQNEIGSSVTDAVRAAKAAFDQGKSLLLHSIIQITKDTFSGVEMASLPSVLQEWYDGLSQHTLENLFPNQENTVLNLIKNVTNDETAFAERIGRTLTGLNVADWEVATLDKFYESLKAFKNTVDTYNAQKHEVGTTENQRYKIVIQGEDGSEQVKSFDRTEYSQRANLLYQDITASIQEMGRSITEQEKRQILIEILLGLC